MSVCLISDIYITIEGAGEGGTLKAGYLDVPVGRIGGGYINSGPTDIPINDDGTFSLRPIWSAQTDPTTARLYILFPDGRAWGGLVPSVAGPLTLYQLKNSYSWGVVSPAALPVLTVVGPLGIIWQAPAAWNSTTVYDLNDGVTTPDGSSWRALAPNVNSYPTDTNANWAFVVLAPDLPRVGTVSTTFAANGSITETSTATGLTVTTSFPANGTIAETYGSPLNRTVTTTFNADGSLVEVTA